jgi:hypothetical protein
VVTHPLESLVVMAMVQQKVNCILWLMEFKSVTHVQRNFWLVHGGSAPNYSSIKIYDFETGSVMWDFVVDKVALG